MAIFIIVENLTIGQIETLTYNVYDFRDYNKFRNILVLL